MKRAGFTLMELLIVVAIIGIVFSIIVADADLNKPQQKTSVVAEHIKTTKFPVKKASADSVIETAWFDDTQGHILWLRSKDGDLVCVLSGKSMELLKKLIRRGRNP